MHSYDAVPIIIRQIWDDDARDDITEDFRKALAESAFDQVNGVEDYKQVDMAVMLLERFIHSLK